MINNSKIKSVFATELPMLLAPMAGAADAAMAIGVAKAGGLGSIACAMLTEPQIRTEVERFRAACPNQPLNLNFFCHQNVKMSAEQERTWIAALSGYYEELKLNPAQEVAFSERRPFDESSCILLEELKPEVVSFHFGLPSAQLVSRLKSLGCRIISSATTVPEALWLEAHGCDAIIAQGYEAGGHRGMFLTDDLSTQIGTIALVPLIVDQVKVPVIAAGGLGDGRGIAAAFALGASAVQLGSAYLLTNESKISPVHRRTLLSENAGASVVTNLFSGKPARSIGNRLTKDLGPMSSKVPPFPFAGKVLAPLKAATEKDGSGDFMSLWSGQAIALATALATALPTALPQNTLSAEELTKRLFAQARQIASS